MIGILPTERISMKTNIGLLFIIIILSILVGSLLKENSTLKAIPATTCPTPIVTMEQLEQAGYQTDGDVFIKISKQE